MSLLSLLRRYLAIRSASAALTTPGAVRDAAAAGEAAAAVQLAGFEARIEAHRAVRRVARRRRVAAARNRMPHR